MVLFHDLAFVPALFTTALRPTLDDAAAFFREISYTHVNLAAALAIFFLVGKKVLTTLRFVARSNSSESFIAAIFLLFWKLCFYRRY